jgi:hypothetical protein
MTRLFSANPKMPCVLAAVGAVCSLALPAAEASSHREAPFIAMNPSVDATDLYIFRSYEGVAVDGTAGRSGYVTLLANYQPFQDPQGGPNFYMFNPNALYEIHIDNNGDGVEDLTFQFRFNNTSKATALTVGGKSVKIPLINSNVLDGTVNPAALNVREQFTVALVRGPRRSAGGVLLTNTSGGASTFDKPVDNIGDKAFGSPTAYAAYAARHVYSVNIPGCTLGGVQQTGKVFVGQRKEPFYIAVGKIFDLVNLNPLGPEVGGNNNDLEAKSVSTLALEVPIVCLTNGTEPVIGAFTTASLRQGRLIDGSPKSGLNKATKEGGAWTQVSRLGMPLVNEVVIGIDDKDKFNASRPKDDASNFADYVTNPALPAVIQTLFPAAPAPTNFPRTDLVTAFLTGIFGVNQPAALASTNPNRVLNEMLRLNTVTAPKPVASQNPLGVAAGDMAGFPNGRRPADDVVDLSLRVAMGALCVLTGSTDALKVGCKPSDAPAGAAPLTDGVRKTAANFGATFPYLTTPLSGNFNPPAAAGTVYP